MRNELIYSYIQRWKYIKYLNISFIKVMNYAPTCMGFTKTINLIRSMVIVINRILDEKEKFH